MHPIIFVIGLEASGTRFLARHVYNLDSNCKSYAYWNGEFPYLMKNGCNNISFIHLSLPTNDFCHSHNIPPIKSVNLHFVQQINYKVDRNQRVFFNITEALNHDSIFALFIKRKSRRKSLKTHCSHTAMQIIEKDIGNKLIDEALLAHPQKVLKLNYDTFVKNKKNIHNFLKENVGIKNCHEKEAFRVP